jgi:hypothetical protein
MFDQLQLPAELSKLMVSITPILGINGKIEEHNLYVLTKYFPIGNNRFVLSFSDKEIPSELTLNVLRKGEDSKIITALTETLIDKDKLKSGMKINSPFYIHSVISFEAKLLQTLDLEDEETIAVFEIVHASGVAGLDPDFNDDITLAKTLEVMSLTAVDTYVIKRKIEK